MRYKVNNGSLEALSSKLPINPLSAEIESFKDGDSWVEYNEDLYIYVKMNYSNVLLKKIPLFYLEFSSDSAFTLSVSSRGWDRIIKYSLDKGDTWNTWNGSQLSGDENNPIYLRGVGNSVITTGNISQRWLFTGKYVTGNIETLLDYQTVASGQHPVMGSNCYSSMFKNCTTLIIPPELPATTLSNYCYSEMFSDCASLITVPKLPAITLTDMCYFKMFYNCRSLKLSTIQDPNIYKYSYRIPASGTGITASSALTDMFRYTGGTFADTPVINTTYYIDHEPI